MEGGQAMSSILHSALQRLVARSPIQISVRFWERRKYIRRYGYESPLLPPGYLPRLPKEKEKLRTQPVYTPKDAWCERRALFGQNDYIDILGNGNLKPVHIMRGVPGWLQGFQGNEFQMLLRKRQVVNHWRQTRPTDFHKLQKRIRWLYKVLNHRTRST
ncbi:39S ribosomal protein L51, mitochondrial isoform X1 [Rhipicephalus sanguineus]|uniref:39S ribosomal protein L51, mitochondrial isoform X1 n=1 Tax=Rhipicephalus sanguineus TaxID=34632 RepID=UPI0020C452AF|nr:39S ribosomal protein L51, mitochondrial isoform X1 [Rhipicephalus sanguineus]